MIYTTIIPCPYIHEHGGENCNPAKVGFEIDDVEVLANVKGRHPDLVEIEFVTHEEKDILAILPKSTLALICIEMARDCEIEEDDEHTRAGHSRRDFFSE